MIEIPETITKGEALEISDSIAGVDSGELFLRGPSIHDENAVIDGDTFTFTVDTVTLEAGLYSLAIWLVIDGTNTLITQSRLEVLANIGDETEPSDQRSQAERIVDALEDFIERGASSPNRRYKINNRELERYTMSDLLDLLNYYKRQVAAENRARTGKGRAAVRFSL